MPRRTVKDVISLSVKTIDYHSNCEDNHCFCNIKQKCSLYEFENDIRLKIHNLLIASKALTKMPFRYTIESVIDDASYLDSSPKNDSKQSVHNQQTESVFVLIQGWS